MSDLLPGLRDELVDAARRLHRRRARRRRLQVALSAAAALILVVAMLAIAVLRSDPAAAGVEIRVVDGRIEVRLTDVETRPDIVEKALRDADVDADVVAAPVGPSNVGRFVALPSAVDPDMVLIDDHTNTFVGFTIPVGFDRPLQLQLGRPAEPDEAYAVASDAYAAGEPLSCRGVYGSTLPDVVGALADEGDLRVRVHPFGSDGEPLADPQPLETAAAALPSHRAVDALATSSTEVLLFATSDGSSPGVVAISPNHGACAE